ncbi:MAG: xanthine dehydrogenase accessory protein XdhC [Rhodobacteraceae bacterium]|nr:xanthine dehydrogenase accessory protein XdhC [Paracoccaceae bacterium]MCW9043014.1 xanthine dehydrogenase accessory protein XdhC [Pseudopelagicola sp.]
MSGLAAFLQAQAAVIRVRIERVRGSSPRETGAEMFVAPETVQGTIGGGQLEYMAIDEARALLARGGAAAKMDVPLGPQIGQCCGGRVEIALQRMDAAMRQTTLEAEAQAQGARSHLYILGAGHVGRALADLAQYLPIRTILVDGRAAELVQCRAEVESMLTPLPEAVVREAPKGSGFVILTHDHALDFLLVAEALGRGDAAYVGMIGSATKRASFASWTKTQGGSDAGLTCPIGAGQSGDKRPEMIAALVLGEVVAALGAKVRVPTA